MNSLYLQIYLQRIKEWFNNHTRESYAGHKKNKILDLTMKKQKLLPDWQAYSQLYYETRLKDVVAAEWPDEQARILEQKENGEDAQNTPTVPPLWFRNKVIRAEYLIETDEVKEEVEKYRKSLLNNSEPENEDDMDAGEVKRVATATVQAK